MPYHTGPGLPAAAALVNVLTAALHYVCHPVSPWAPLVIEAVMVPPSPGRLALLVDFSPPRPITLIDADLIDAHASSRHLSFFSLPPPPLCWLGSRVVSVLDSGAEGPGFKSQPRRCRVTVLGKLFAPIVPVFTKQRNW